MSSEANFSFFFFVCSALIFTHNQRESRAACETHNNHTGLVYLKQKKKEKRKSGLTLIHNLPLMDYESSVSSLHVVAEIELILILNSGAAVLKYMTYLRAY